MRSYQGVCRATDGEWVELLALVLGYDDLLLGVPLTPVVFSLLTMPFPLHYFTPLNVVTLDSTIPSVSTI